MTPDILIDMVNTTVFKESEWIGANKEYPDVPMSPMQNVIAFPSHKACWTQAAKGGQSADRMAMGNTANVIVAAISNAKKVCIVIIYTDYWVKYLENRLWREDTRSFVNSKSLVSILSPPHTSLLTVHLKAEFMSWSWLVKVSVLHLELFYLHDIVLICEIVIVMYAQSAAKNVRHESADTTSGNCGESYLVI